MSSSGSSVFVPPDEDPHWAPNSPAYTNAFSPAYTANAPWAPNSPAYTHALSPAYTANAPWAPNSPAYTNAFSRWPVPVLGTVFPSKRSRSPSPTPIVRKRRRTKKKSVSDSTISRIKVFHGIDRYYAERYSQNVGIDDRLLSLLKMCGNDWFINKRILELDCGCGFVSMYIAAYLGASQVVGREKDTERIFKNLKQLRKFKHDGIRIDKGQTAEYPQILVKRSGPAEICNKPWRVYSDVVQTNFPHNIEFQLQEESDEKFDIVLAWNNQLLDLNLLTDGGFIVVLGDRNFPQPYKRVGRLYVYQKMNP